MGREANDTTYQTPNSKVTFLYVDYNPPHKILSTAHQEQAKRGNLLELAPHLFPTRQLHDLSTHTCLHDKSGPKFYSGLIPQEFIEELTCLLEEIFNPDIPFSPTEDKAKCKDCYLAQICQLPKRD